MKRMTCCLLIGVLLLCLAACSPAENTDTLCITELQSAGGEADWIELYNYGERAVSLQGWYLSDDPDSPGKAALPTAQLQAGERLVLSTADVLTFRLSADGETVVLSNPHGEAAHTVALPAAVPGLSYGALEGDIYPPTQFAWYAAPTPGQPNSMGMVLGENATNTEYGVRINECVARNKASLYDSEGDYGDWIELYNTADTAVVLSGWSLTDNESELDRWRFPENTVLPAGGYLLIFCDGKNSAENGEYHTNFRLGENDDYVGLYTADGSFCSGVTCNATEQDVAYGCNESGATVRCRYPTPGYANAAETEVAP